MGLNIKNDPSAAHRRAKRHANVRKLLGELHSSLTDDERTQLRATERQLYDDAGLPS